MNLNIYRFTNSDNIIKAALKYESYLNNNNINEVDTRIICSRKNAFNTFDDFYDKEDYLSFYWQSNVSIEIVEDTIEINKTNRIHFTDMKAVEITKQNKKIVNFKILLFSGMIIKIQVSD